MPFAVPSAHPTPAGITARKVLYFYSINIILHIPFKSKTGNEKKRKKPPAAVDRDGTAKSSSWRIFDGSQK